MNNYYYITEYLPKRYNANEQQERDRKMCYAFKDGILSDTAKQMFLNKAKIITGGQSEGWIVCFIPASTATKTTIRYRQLSAAFREVGYHVEQDAIFNIHDKQAEHLVGKTGNPIESFGFNRSKVSGKKVLLIDDIITRGTTFNLAADELKSNGAESVTGLFLAKTINPDYHPSYYNEEPYEPDGYWDEEDTYEHYNGSYAQDVEGWSDQDIDDVLDGDPDAYWNID